MIYYTKEEFIEKSKVSCSTIDRFYRQYPEIGEERKEVGKRKDIPETHLKYFDLGLMIKIDQEKNDKIKTLKNVIKLGMDEKSFPASLWKQDWDFFCTVSHRFDFSKDTCYHKMTQLHENLLKVFGAKNITMFFTTESFHTRDGHHNHFVIRTSDTISKDAVAIHMKNYFRSDRFDIEPYNPEEAGLFYISKKGLEGTDWDYLF